MAFADYYQGRQQIQDLRARVEKVEAELEEVRSYTVDRDMRIAELQFQLMTLAPIVEAVANGQGVGWRGMRWEFVRVDGKLKFQAQAALPGLWKAVGL